MVTNGFDGQLVEKIGTAPKQNLTEIIFEISTSNLEHNFHIFGFDSQIYKYLIL